MIENNPLSLFALDSRLEKSSAFVCDLPLCQLRIQDDSRYPWFVLIPRLNDVTELYQLSAANQTQLMVEITKVSTYIAHNCPSQKINVASLGNVVAQLHIHVVGRLESDETWPQPVFGLGTPVPYSDVILEQHIKAARAECLS